MSEIATLRIFKEGFNEVLLELKELRAENNELKDMMKELLVAKNSMKSELFQQEVPASITPEEYKAGMK